MPMNETLGTISAIDTAYLLPAMDTRPRTETARLNPPTAVAPAPARTSPFSAEQQKELVFRIIQVIAIIGAIGLGLYLLSR
jgi:amino acid permease